MEFNDVFKRELKDIRARNIPAGGESKDGLPPLPQFKDFPSTQETTLEPENLNKALKEIYCKKQDKTWRDGIKKAEDKEGKAGHPGLVGLALSGGGIRSATFNLGVIQALKKSGIFDSIHYLSTVSGGGYIGSCLSSLAAARDGVPGFQSAHGKGAFEHYQGKEEARPVRHLRNNAKFLAPEGLIDILRAPTLMFRGILINFLVILPYILLAVVVTVIIKPNEKSLREHSLLDVLSFLGIFGESFLVTKTLVVLVGVSFAFYPLALMVLQKFDYFGRPQWESRDISGNFYGLVLALIGLAAFIELQPFAVNFFVGGQVGEVSQRIPEYLKKGPGQQDILTALGAIAAVIAPLFLGKKSDQAPGRRRSLGIYLAAGLSILVFWLLYLNLCRWALSRDAAGNELELLPNWLWRQIVYAAPEGMEPFTAEALAIFIIVGVSLWIYSFLFVDVNFTSLHNFYRDRLSKAYLISWDGTDDEDSLIQNDEQLLSKLDVEHAPYHLINAAVNINHRKEAFRKGRHADFFIFSKHFIGGNLTGYCDTEAMETARSHVNLGTAMAISGAAASPTMGKATVKPLVFAMAMLNIRLNYWLPNPRTIKKRARRALRNPAKRAGPFYLILEMFGRLSADSWNVNLSDGGHVENLGVFELLRRECRLIIVGDGECDPLLRFQAVAELKRLAQIDLSINIEMEGLDQIRNGLQHHAIGTIHYKDGKLGKLVYLKSSLLGDDALQSTLPDDFYESSSRRRDDRLYDQNAYIAHYKANNPAFPHESTADLFYDETQFECYRALGYEVTKSVFGLDDSARPQTTAIEQDPIG